MAEIMFSLLLWIGDNSHHDVYLNLPNISQVEPANMCRQYSKDNIHHCDSSKLIGFYNKADTIFLNLNFTADTLNEQSQLLHELVHFVQWENMSPREDYCLGEIEAEAYRLQNRWRAQHNLKPVSDEFTLMMLAAS